MPRFEVLLDTTVEAASRRDAAKLHLEYEVVQPNGPGGGWPEIRVCGEEDDVEEFLKRHFGDKREAEDYFDEFAKQIS